MNNAAKISLIAVTAAFLVTAPLMFVFDFLCFDGFLVGMIFYALVLALIIMASGNINTGLKAFSLNALIIIQLVYVVFIPLGMLVHSGPYGGFPFFLRERFIQYIYQESSVLTVLLLSANFYARERMLYTGELKQSLFSPLTLALVVRTLWLIFVEFRNLSPNFVAGTGFPAEYIVLVFIPLFIAVLLLTIRKNLAGYLLGIILALSGLVITPVSASAGLNTGGGAAVIIITCLVIFVFSVRGIMHYHFDNGFSLSVPAQFVMRNVLKIKRLLGKKSRILKQAGITENMKILDYGCGIGNYSMEAAKLTGDSGTVICVDISEKMLSELKKRIKAAGLTNVEPVIVNSLDDLPGGSFDFILLIDILHLIKDKTAIVNTLINKLSDSGRLLIKFEHFNDQQIESLLDSFHCSFRKRVKGKYWLLSR